MYIQLPKAEIDVGEIGNANTGDILFDGGNKINQNSNNIYNAFGDQRFYDNNSQTMNQTIHATGYYQKVDQYAFRTPVALGTMWDVDTTTGGASPSLVNGKVGESVFFINSNGSLSVTRPLIIEPSNGSFVGVSGGLRITQPFSKVECWCISAENNVYIWNYSVTSLFGSKETPVEITQAIPQTETKIKLAHSSEYNSIKLLLLAQSTDGTKIRQSEVNILVDNRLKNVLDTEFAVMRVGNSGENDEIMDIKYEVGTDGNVNLIAKALYPNMRLAVKSIAVQRVGSA